jgi:protein-S-isoprenylcysteine O-methyltransferase Ste14
MHPHPLDLKIPPPVVAALIGGAMWGISLSLPLLETPTLVRRATALILTLTGVGFSAAGVISFHRAKTTVNPMKPEATSSLVCKGIYSVTRNPMYVGVLIVLIGWAVFLSSAWALLGPLAFVLYINRFQISPEEQVLSDKFGAEYLAYQARVRRWL